MVSDRFPDQSPAPPAPAAESVVLCLISLCKKQGGLSYQFILATLEKEQGAVKRVEGGRVGGGDHNMGRGTLVSGILGTLFSFLLSGSMRAECSVTFVP